MTFGKAATILLAVGSIVAAAPMPGADVLAGFADMLLLRHRTADAFDTFVAADLIQHNPAATGDGRAAAIALVQPLFSTAGARFEISSLIADGNYGFLYFRGTLGSPDRRAAVAELYRIAGGKLVEHWDAFQPIPTHAVSHHPMFGALAPGLPPGPGGVCVGATPEDRAVVTGFADLLYGRHDVRAAFERYATPGMIQHDPGLPDGREAAIAELTPLFARPGTHTTVAHILACRGMGVIHLRSRFGAAPGHVIFDIVRIANGRITEHWDVFQPVVAGINPRPPI